MRTSLTVSVFLWTLIISACTCTNTAQEEGSSLRRRTQGDDDFGLHDVETRIVGGTQADADDFEYIVNLGGCGGSLIAPDVVLTAAHCGEINPWSVRIGGGTSLTGQLKYIERGSATYHPRYRPNSQDNDFMLYKLTSPVRGLTPITLNNNSAVPSGDDKLTVAGFGSTEEGGDTSFFLNKVDVNHVSYAVCNLAYIARVDRKTMFCAGTDGGGKDSCQGDSGGPIVDQNGVLVGVTSWGNGCGRRFYPGVYARISSAYDWILQETCRLSEDSPAFCDGVEIPDAPSNSGGGSGSDSSESGGVGFWDWLAGLFGF